MAHLADGCCEGDSPGACEERSYCRGIVHFDEVNWSLGVEDIFAPTVLVFGFIFLARDCSQFRGDC